MTELIDLDTGSGKFSARFDVEIIKNRREKINGRSVLVPSEIEWEYVSDSYDDQRVYDWAMEHPVLVEKAIIEYLTERIIGG